MGHYDERLELERQDEFGHLAGRFNAMAAELERWKNSNLARILAEKARAEAVINSLRDPSIGVDEQRQILFMNRQAAELLGVASGDLIGMSAEEAMRRNDLLAHILSSQGSATFKAVLQGREQQFTVEGSDIDTGQARVGTVYILHNITPYLERDQAKTMFLATISHELKTPLASSDIGLGLLERNIALSATQQAILIDLRKDHQRLVRIVSELLDLAQLESGRMRITVAPHPLQPSVLEACTAVHALAQARGIALHNDLPIDLPPVLHDPDRTIWVLVNLLSNALRHAPAGSTILIASEVEGELLGLLVTDEGTGIAEPVREHLFKPFGEGAAGSGLGLSIARRFMEAMQGGIAVEPIKPHGTRIRLTFRKV
jgi:PAS domain S-box-containing protein